MQLTGITNYQLVCVNGLKCNLLKKDKIKNYTELAHLVEVNSYISNLEIFIQFYLTNCIYT